MPKTGRLEIRATNEFIERLDVLAKESGTSKAEIIDRAVGLYEEALREAKAGKTIQYIEDSQPPSNAPQRITTEPKYASLKYSRRIL